MTTPVELSVIISAYNRGRELHATLESVLEQQADETAYEVIAVDNNSTDDTAAVIQGVIERGDARLQYVFESRQGVSHGRNAGLRVARGAIVAFTDDDVLVSPTWVRTIVRRFAENPEVDYVTGVMRPVYEVAPPAWLAEDNRGPIVLRDRGPHPLYSRPGCFFPGWATANIAFRRAVFDRVGPFSGDFPRGQDLELIIRVWQANGRGMYAPDVVVSHRIPAERLTKAYHRMWHTREGDIRARVYFREIFDADDRARREPAPVARVLGVPRFLLCEIVADAVRWLAATLRADERAAFHHETRLRQAVAYARTAFRRRHLHHRPAPQLQVQ